MANCSKLFLDFNSEITPTKEQMQEMKTSREALETKISDALQEKLQMTASYYTQGSGASKMKTIIIKADGTYDADRGIYLPEKPNVNAETIQKYVYDAVKDHTEDGAQHRQKCIRVLYKSAYNIDFPVYYEVPNESYSYLAHKEKGWIKDDPSKMIEWFLEHKDESGQLLRIVKYLKAWASNCSCKMPSGIALTVWAAQNFAKNKDRDDKCLLQVLKEIKGKIVFTVSCSSPVEPFDDLVAKLTDQQKNNFRQKLDDFCVDAQAAVDETNQLKASRIWRKYFGDRFPEGVDEDVDKKAAALMGTAAIVLGEKARLNSEGFINESFGIQHQTHRNFGG